MSGSKRKNPQTAYYVYGVMGCVNGKAILIQDEKAIDEAWPVYSLPYKELEAIISKVSLREFGEGEIKLNLQNPGWVEAKVAAHLRILEKVLAHQTIVPLKFGTVYRSEKLARDMLAEQYDTLLNALTKVENEKKREK